MMELLHTGFEAWALTNPSDLALIIAQPEHASESPLVTFAELNACAEALADAICASLTHAEATTGFQSIGICCRGGSAGIVSILAALKANMPWVPLDSASSERFKFMYVRSSLIDGAIYCITVS